MPVAQCVQVLKRQCRVIKTVQAMYSEAVSILKQISSLYSHDSVKLHNNFDTQDCNMKFQCIILRLEEIYIQQRYLHSVCLLFDTLLSVYETLLCKCKIVFCLFRYFLLESSRYGSGFEPSKRWN